MTGEACAVAALVWASMWVGWALGTIFGYRVRPKVELIIEAFRGVDAS